MTQRKYLETLSEVECVISWWNAGVNSTNNNNKLNQQFLIFFSQDLPYTCTPKYLLRFINVLMRGNIVRSNTRS